MAKETLPFIQVYCPECKEFIKPGEWTMCPYFDGKKLNFSKKNEALKQIFRCHVQCGCEIQYRYYEGGKLVTKTQKVIEDEDTLNEIVSLVAESKKRYEKKKTKKVLLVDDDPDFLEMHSVVLKNKGYEVITASNTKQCMDKLKDVRPDIVILDVMMDQFDSGFKASKKIKEKYDNLPVMLLTSIGLQTGLDFSSNEEILKITGANVLLDKPVSPKVLIDEIEKLTE